MTHSVSSNLTLKQMLEEEGYALRWKCGEVGRKENNRYASEYKYVRDEQASGLHPEALCATGIPMCLGPALPSPIAFHFLPARAFADAVPLI